jgi:hypothetical protein
VLENKSKTISKAVLALAEIIRKRITEISDMETEQVEVTRVKV